MGPLKKSVLGRWKLSGISVFGADMFLENTAVNKS